VYCRLRTHSNVWHNVLSHICGSIGRHFILCSSVNMLIRDDWLCCSYRKRLIQERRERLMASYVGRLRLTIADLSTLIAQHSAGLPATPATQRMADLASKLNASASDLRGYTSQRVADMASKIKGSATNVRGYTSTCTSWLTNKASGWTPSLWKVSPRVTGNKRDYTLFLCPHSFPTSLHGGI